jgi:hypothetical protein
MTLPFCLVEPAPLQPTQTTDNEIHILQPDAKRLSIASIDYRSGVAGGVLQSCHTPTLSHQKIQREGVNTNVIFEGYAFGATMLYRKNFPYIKCGVPPASTSGMTL